MERMGATAYDPDRPLPGEEEIDDSWWSEYKKGAYKPANSLSAYAQNYYG